MQHTPSPRIIRQNIRLAVVLIILAMAALWLRPLRVHGGEPQGGLSAQATIRPEKFVPDGMPLYAGATLEMRPEVNVLGDEVKLKNVCRWADGDKAAFEAVADLVLIRLPKSAPFRTLTMRELRETLTDAGLNMAVLRLAGATTCTVARTDVKYDERTALDQWIAAREAGQAKPALIEAPRGVAREVKPVAAPEIPLNPAVSPEVAQPAPERPVTITTPEPKPEPKAVKTLRDILIAEAAERLGLAAEDVQAHFNPANDRLLNLSEPLFKFGVIGPRHKLLGETSWDVSIIAEGASQNVRISATLRAWQKQTVITRPVASRQVLGPDDVIERRTIVERIMDDPMVTKEQVIGQMAGRDLRMGTVLTTRLVEAPILIRPGQMVTIQLTQGGISAKAVAKATEQGSLGQTVRVRNEATGNLFDVVVTGPQMAKMAAGVATSAEIVIR